MCKTGLSLKKGGQMIQLQERRELGLLVIAKKCSRGSFDLVTVNQLLWHEKLNPDRLRRLKEDEYSRKKYYQRLYQSLCGSGSRFQSLCGSRFQSLWASGSLFQSLWGSLFQSLWGSRFQSRWRSKSSGSASRFQSLCGSRFQSRWRSTRSTGAPLTMAGAIARANTARRRAPTLILTQ